MVAGGPPSIPRVPPTERPTPLTPANRERERQARERERERKRRKAEAEADEPKPSDDPKGRKVDIRA